MGTGDGRLPFVRARESSERFFVGLDANAAGLRELSRRALRARMPNLAYLRAAVEELPLGLAGVADQVTVVLPWGSLLAAVALPEPALLGRLRAVCQPGATLTLVLGTDAARDAGELGRLGLTGLAPRSLASRLGDGYAAAGFEIAHVRLLPPRELAGWPSSWARRLAHASGRSFAQVDARAL